MAMHWIYALVCALACASSLGCGSSERGSDAQGDTRDGSSSDTGGSSGSSSAGDSGGSGTSDGSQASSNGGAASTSNNATADGDGATTSSDGASTSGSETPSVASLEEFMSAIADAICARVEGCPLYQAFGLFRDTESCFEIYDGWYDAILPRFQALIESGTVAFDAEQAAACLELYNQPGCVISDYRRSACELFLAGTTPAGGSCTDDFECVPGNYCNLEASCPGTCAAVVGMGMDCLDDSWCERTLLCGSDDTCVVPAELDEACQSGLDCSPGLACDAISRTCYVRRYFELPEGAACTSGFDCEPNLYCTLLEDDEPTCQPRLPTGSVCASSYDAACQAELYCSVAEGETDGTCANRVEAGQPCDDADACLYGVCDGGTCRDYQTIGGSCASGEACPTGVCEEGSCALPPECPEE